jgi:autophagy-related protein 33
MGTCLAVIKVIGVTTLGVYTGSVATNALNGYDIVKYVLESSATINNIKQINAFITKKLATNGIFLSVLGSISSIAFQLAYNAAPARSKHPYLIYSSLVFPISSVIYGLVSRKQLLKFFYLDWFLANSKPVKDAKPKKEPIRSELDNSVYKDLGDSSSVDEHGEDEDAEIEAEVDFHLSKRVAQEALDSVQFANKFVSVLSVLGFVIASVGVHGDF